MQELTDKKELRAQMRRRNRSLAADERVAASESIFRRVEVLPAFAAARTVALYCSLPDEPDTVGVLERWSAVKKIYLPRVGGDTMCFCEYGPDEMCAGAFGITEPSAGARACDPAAIDLIIVPGVAFTAAGARMGRGRGYYDKYLSQPNVRAVKVGVCFAHQIVADLPMEPHDVAMDFVCC